MNGNIFFLLLPLTPFLALVVWSSYRLLRRYLSSVMNEVGGSGFVFAFLAVLCVIAVDAALHATGFLNEFFSQTFVLVPFVAVVVLPLALVVWRSHWLAKLMSIALTIGVAMVAIFIDQYLSTNSLADAFNRWRLLQPSSLAYVMVLVCAAHIAIRIKFAKKGSNKGAG
jgi:hypothetical protein